MKSFRLALILLAVAVPAATAQIGPTDFAARRDSLARRIGDGVVIAFGARTPVTDFGPPTQLPAFHYLTGFDEPDAALVMVVHGGAGTSTLFTMPIDPRVAMYYGRRPDSAAIATGFGLTARPFATLRGAVDSLAGSGLTFYSLADFEDADFAYADSLTRGRAFLQSVTAAHSGLQVKDAHPLVNQLRARKSAAELALLRKAAALSVEGHRAAMRIAAPGLHEYDLQAAAEYEFRRGGASRPAYGSIVGSGENGTQLHYMRDRAPLKAGDLVVIDAAREYQGYAADVTRTLPVSGRFTKEQRALYQLVRDAQDAAVRNAKPGMKFSAAQDSSVAVRAAGLARMGLIESADAIYDPPGRANCTARPARLPPGECVDHPRHQPRARPRRARSGAVLLRRRHRARRATYSPSSPASTSTPRSSASCPTRRGTARSSRRCGRWRSGSIIPASASRTTTSPRPPGSNGSARRRGRPPRSRPR